jgi:hypothetical protein
MKEMNEEVSRDTPVVHALVFVAFKKQAVSHGDSSYNLELSAATWRH